MVATERRGFRVAGRVQGVGFRWATASAAEALGLRGAVRNAPDGCVEVVAEGPAEALAALARWLETGPPAARVERVEAAEPALVVPEGGFRVVR